jgi:hypothetical protein
VLTLAAFDAASPTKATGFAANKYYTDRHLEAFSSWPADDRTVAEITYVTVIFWQKRFVAGMTSTHE